MTFTKKALSLALAIISAFAMFGCDKDKDDQKEQLPENLQKRQEYVEHLNEKYADYKEVPYGLDITKKTDLVGICYSTWFTRIMRDHSESNPPPNITNILEKAKETGVAEWGGLSRFHYWAEPALGYYKSDDEMIIRTHMTQLAEAGVDYIIIDNTNVSTIYKEEWNWYVTKPCTAILDTIVAMRAEGKKTPYVVFWCASNKTPAEDKKWTVVEAVYDEFHTQEKWKDCFVYWDGKPFMLNNEAVVGAPKCDITLRRMWGLNPNPGVQEWSFLGYDTNPMVYDQGGFVEQTCVCTAAQQSYMSDTLTAHGRNHGVFMYSQWARAFEYRPKCITITWWNEWAAQRQPDDENGNPRFVDNYTAEYSRDIEPMKGGHGDQYYQWMKQYIAAYKNLDEKAPVLVEAGFEHLTAGM